MSPLTAFTALIDYLYTTFLVMIAIPISLVTVLVADVQRLTVESFNFGWNNTYMATSFVTALAFYWLINEYLQGRGLHAPSCFERAWGWATGEEVKTVKGGRRASARRRSVAFEGVGHMD